MRNVAKRNMLGYSSNLKILHFIFSMARCISGGSNLGETIIDSSWYAQKAGP